MLKKALLYLSLFMLVAGSAMFYVVDARRTAARLQRSKDQQAYALLEKQKADQQRALLLAQRANDPTAQRANDPTAQRANDPTAQRANDPMTQTETRAPASPEDMNEILRQAPIEFEHLKKNSKIEQIAHSMQQKSKKALSDQVIADAKSAKWRSQITAAGYEISARRKPSNVNTVTGDLVTFSEPEVSFIPFGKLVTTCHILKNPTFSAVLKINVSGKVMAVAAVSKDDVVPSEEIQRCKFRFPSTKSKITIYKTMITPARKTGSQAKL